MITSAAAPSFSGHELPAVTSPSGLKAGCELLQFLERRGGPRPVVGETTVPSSFV